MTASPRLDEPALQKFPTANAARKPARRPCALVVDEDPALRRMVAEVLEGAGLRVVEAVGPREAFAAFLEAGGFDLLVLTVAMRGMSGPQLADALRDPGQDQRVLFVSSGPKPPVLGPGRRFLAKPFTTRDLIAQVRALVEKR